MPLLNKQPFVPNPVPENLDPDDEVFYFWRTNEIFTNHDEYFRRYLQAHSLVWTCSRTGRSGLTYDEALESEQSTEDPQQSVKKRRKRKKNAEDTIGDHDDLETPKRGRKKAKTDTTSPNLEGGYDGENDTINDSRVDDHEQNEQSADGQPQRKKKKKYPYDPKKYAMPVPEGFDPSLLTPTGKIDGRKLKSKKNQDLADALLAASGYVPKPPSSTPGKRGKKPKSEEARREDEARKKEDEVKNKAQLQAELAREREQEAKRKKEALALAKQLEKQKKEDERKKATAFLQNWDKKCEDLERDDLKQLPQPTPVCCDIPERLFGDSIFIMEAIYNFHDLHNFVTIYPEGMTFDTLEEVLLDNHEDGALGTLIQFLLRVIFDTQPTQDGYGLDDDSMRVLKQTNSNAHANNKNNKSGIKADNGNDSDATDCGSEHEHEHEDQHQEEDEDEHDNEDENGEKYVNMNDRIGSAIRAAREFKKTLTKPLPDMELDSSNVTEILRLHLLQSGSFPKGRTIYNGWYSSREDPGLWLCMQEPDLIKKLGEGTVYDLEIEDRIKILHTLIYQLLTFIKSRLFMDAASEQLTELRKQYRKDAAEFARWDRENCIKRMQPPKRKNDQAPGGNHDNKHSNDQKQSSELNHDRLMGDDDGEAHALDENKDNHQNLKSCLKSNGTAENLEDDDEQMIGTKSKKISFEKNLNGTVTNGHSNCNGVEQSDAQNDEQSYEDLERAYQQNTVDYEDYQRERAIRWEELNATLLELRTQLRQNQSIYAIHPIGRDRAFRRYWLFQSLPGLFVEQDEEYPGRCLPQSTPLESQYKKYFGKDNPLRQIDEADLIKPKTQVKSEQSTTDTEQQDTKAQLNEDPNQSSIITDEMNYCTGDEATCLVHGPNRPREKWWFYHQPDSIDRLVETLNKRGHRESELQDVLSAESSLIKPKVAECPAYKLNKTILEASGIRRSRRLRTKTGKRKGRKAYDD